jgi:hypothetical protein
MMNKLALALVALVAVGCNSITKEELSASEARTGVKISQAVTDLEQKLHATDAKYASMLALEQMVKNGVEKIDKNVTLLESANSILVKVLQAQKNALKEQLQTIDDQITALSK